MPDGQDSISILLEVLVLLLVGKSNHEVPLSVFLVVLDWVSLEDSEPEAVAVLVDSVDLGIGEGLGVDWVLVGSAEVGDSVDGGVGEDSPGVL